jgi:prepilin-type N-terminal cleavage/methylation domain-containing protein
MTRIRQRAGFTLIELLIVIAIIGILMSLTGAAVFKTIQVKRRSNTQQTVQKLYLQLQRQMKAVIDDARTEPVTSNQPLMTLAGGDANRARIIWIKMRLKQQFPQSYAEAINPAPGYLNPEPAYGRILAGKSSANNPLTESAACLLMALTAVSRRGAQQDADFLNSLERTDTDGDGIPEICDGYGNAVAFFRWPTPGPSSDPNYILLTTAPPSGWNPNPTAKYQDVQDPTGTLQATGWSGAATLQGMGIPTPNRYMVPVVVSAGPDGLMGIDPNTMSVTSISQNQDNIYSDPRNN